MIDSWYCLDRIVPGEIGQILRRSDSESGTINCALVLDGLDMVSAFKWVLYALFGTISVVKLLHSFEYWKIPLYDALKKDPLYYSTIFKSWIKIFIVTIFKLPNKSLIFLLSHSDSLKLLYVFDWCCFYYFVRNSPVALLEALCARIFSWDSWISVFFWHFFLCVQGL